MRDDGDSRTGLPPWLVWLVVGVLAFAAGVIVGASFTIGQRRTLQSSVARLESREARLDAKSNEQQATIQEQSAELAAKARAVDALAARVDRLERDVRQLHAESDETRQRLADLVTGGQEAGAVVSADRANGQRGAEASGDKDAAGDGVDDPAVSSGRCTAITQRGSRCKRRARSNGLCWQHGG